jgi:hypothetical protein
MPLMLENEQNGYRGLIENGITEAVICGTYFTAVIILAMLAGSSSMLTRISSSE